MLLIKHNYDKMHLIYIFIRWDIFIWIKMFLQVN